MNPNAATVCQHDTLWVVPSILMSHGHFCFWTPDLGWLYVLADAVIVLAYFSIPIALVYFVRNRRDITFAWMFVCLGIFMLAGGATHLMEIWNERHSGYSLSVAIKVIAALASVPTAILLARLVPALRASEERFRSYFELGLIGTAISSPTKGWVEVNDEVCRILGYERSELLRMTWAELTHPDDLAGDVADFKRVLAGEIDSYARGKRFIRKDGRVIDAIISVRCLRRADGSVDYFVALIQDITERKQAEEALAEQALRYKTLMETSMDSIYVLDEKGDLQEANAAFLSRRGYTAAEVKGLNVADWDARVGREQLQERMRKLAGSSAVFETQHRCKDGSIFDVEVCATSVRVGGEQLFFVVTRDITERKRVEQSQRESRLRYETLVQSIDGIVWEADPKTFNLTFVSKQAERILGYPLERWFEEPNLWLDHIHPDDRDWAVKFCVDARVRGEDHQFEYRMISADGRVIWLNDIVTLDIAPDQSVILRGLMVDITERKQAEAALAVRARQQAVIGELGKLALAGGELQSLFDQTVAAVAETLGVEYCKVLELLPDGNAVKLVAGVGWKEGFVGRATVALGYDTQAGYTLLTKNLIIVEDLSRETRFIGAPLLREHGVVSGLSVIIGAVEKPFGVLGAHTARQRTFTADDMHFFQSVANTLAEAIQRKQAEDRLRRSEEKFKALFGIAPVGISLLDRQHNIVDANPALERIVRLSREELLGGAYRRRSYLNADGTPKLFDELPSEAAVTKGRPINDVEVGIVTEDGEIIWTQVSVAPLALPEANAVVITQDITERKQAEQELRESEARTRLLVKSSNVGLWDWNLLTNEAFYSPKWKSQLGYEDDEVPARHEEWENRLHPEDRGPCLRAVKDFREGRIEDFETEFRLRHKDGSWRSILSRADLIRGAAGQPLRMMGCHIDITERKIAEAALRDSEERFRELAENINEVFWIWTATPGNAGCLYVSPAYATIWGRSCESLYSSPKSWMEALHPQDKGRVREEGVRMDFETITDWTYRIVRPDQSIRWIRDRIFPVRDAHGAVVRFAGIAEDITESKEAEEQVRKANRQLRTLSRRRIQEQEDERRRLSRELHDQIGQSLTAAKINVEVLGATENPALVGRIDETIAILDQLLGQVRQISLDLRPPMLDDLGLVPALRSFVDEQGRRASVAVRFSAEHVPEKLDAEIQITCFRIAQEAITNAVRHAKATQLDIVLRCTSGKKLRLLARDNGMGFAAQPKQAQALDLGLIGIRERAALVGGRAKIISSPRKGTTIDVSLPLTFRPEPSGRRPGTSPPA